MHVSDEDDDYVLDLNLRAAFKMCQAAGRVMLSHRSEYSPGAVTFTSVVWNSVALAGTAAAAMGAVSPLHPVRLVLEARGNRLPTDG